MNGLLIVAGIVAALFAAVVWWTAFVTAFGTPVESVVRLAVFLGLAAAANLLIGWGLTKQPT